MTSPLKTTLTALVATAALGLAGCGTDQTSDHGGMGGMDHGSSASTSAPSSSPGASASARHDEADVRFVQMMLPHHEQAVAMSATLLQKTGVDPEVAALAQQVRDAQQPEIDTMKDFLDAWGQPETGDLGGMSGMDHGDDGMATATQLDELRRVDGKAGQKLYLQLMTAHHEGAVAMAHAEVRGGQDPDAVALADNIVTSQQREIGLMRDLLARL
jgi:uncharacterized protein (DUF305 family)